jgi:hypothetical protein
MTKSLPPLGIAGCRAASSDYAIHFTREYIPDEAVRDFIIARRFNSEVQQRCIDDMAEHRGWGKGRGQGRKSPAAMRA